MSKSEDASVEREVEHTTETDATSSALPANLSERQHNIVQFDAMKAATVEEGLLKLGVSLVTKAENSEKWAIEVEHPIEGTHRVFVDAPTEGVVPGSEMYELLQWYGVSNPYHLQLGRVYVEKQGDDCDYAHGWEIVAPPGYKPDPPRPIKEQLKFKYDRWIGVSRPSFTATTLYLFLLGGSMAGAVLPPVPLGPTWVGSIITAAIAFAFVTVVAMILLDAQGN